MGLDVPGPGSGVFQRTPSSFDHLSGSPVCSLFPCPPGPRNCVQSVASQFAAIRVTKSVEIRGSFFKVESPYRSIVATRNPLIARSLSADFSLLIVIFESQLILSYAIIKHQPQHTGSLIESFNFQTKFWPGFNVLCRLSPSTIV